MFTQLNNIKLIIPIESLRQKCRALYLKLNYLEFHAHR